MRDEKRVARCRRRRFEVSFELTVPVWDDPIGRRVWSDPGLRATIVSDIKDLVARQVENLGLEEATGFGGKGRVTRLRVRFTP